MVVWVVFRHLLARGIRFVLLHKVSTLLVVLLSAALVMATSGRFSGLSVAHASYTPANTSVPPAPATVQYMEGNRTFNAQLIWDSLSEDLHAMAQTKGEDLSSLQKRLDASKASGGKVVDTAYVGGYQPPDGNAMYFYVMTLAGGSQNLKPERVYYVFTVGQDGKITSIE